MTNLKEELTNIMYGADWRSGPAAKAFKPDVEAALAVFIGVLHTLTEEVNALQTYKLTADSKDLLVERTDVLDAIERVVKALR